MNLGAVSETITVSGASPLVDMTIDGHSTELTREQLEVLPTTRDGFKAFMGQVPGVRTNLDVGSSGLTDGVVFRVYGQLGESWHMLEGVLASSPTSTAAAAATWTSTRSTGRASRRSAATRRCRGAACWSMP